jgi:tetratricopeptide (TPR) repeat protein
VALYLRGSARVEEGVQQRVAQLLRDGIADAREAISLGGRENVIYYLPYLYGMTNLSIIENRKEHAQISAQQADVALAAPGIKPDEKSKLIYQRGLAKGFLGETDSAVRDFEEAIRLDPQFLAAYTAEADTLARADRRDAAKAAFDRAVKQFPSNPLVYNNRGMFFQQSNQPEKAVADLTRSVELDPNYFFAYTNRGVTLMLLDKPEAAEADFTTSLKINPQQPMVYGLRGTARVAEGKFDEAIADHQKALQMVPNHPSAITDLGFAQFFAGRYEDAVRSFEKALEVNPNFTQLQPWRIAALEELGRKDAAAAEFSPIFDKPAEQRDWMENLVAFQFDRISADQLLAAVAAEEPAKTAQRAEAEYFIGRKLAQHDHPDEAKDAYQRVLQTGAKHLSAYRGAKFALAAQQ